MMTIILWWLVASVICATINYFLMKGTDYDDDA